MAEKEERREKGPRGSMVLAARDLSKPNTDALAMEERGNEMKVTKRGRKIDEGAGWRGGGGIHRPPQPLNRSLFLKRKEVSQDV